VPIYEYRCRKCHEVIERIQGVQDPPLRKCPACRGRLEKMMSPGSFILKGNGWYATDYTNKGVAKGAACPAAADSTSPACAGCPKAE